MATQNLITLSPDQLRDANTNLANIDRIIKNGDALVDAGVLTAQELQQAKDTKEILMRTLKAYGPKQ